MSDPNVRFDLRTVKRYLNSGRLEKAEYQSFLEKLDDAAENITPRDEGGDEDGFEERFANKAEADGEAAEPAAPQAAAPVVPSAPAAGDAPAPPPPPLEVPIGSGGFGPPKVD